MKTQIAAGLIVSMLGIMWLIISLVGGDSERSLLMC